MARHAELQTVDANQTVFLQGLYYILYPIISLLTPFSCPAILVRNPLFIRRFDLLLSVLGLIGEVGGDFYFVLQGSVAIKINNKVIKVCGSQVCFWSFRILPLRSRIIAP